MEKSTSVEKYSFYHPGHMQPSDKLTPKGSATYAKYRSKRIMSLRKRKKVQILLF